MEKTFLFPVQNQVVFFFVSVLCPTLIDINNGDVFVSTNGTVTTAIFSCSNGYSIHGNIELFCDITSYWSSASPTCGMYTYKLISGKTVLSFFNRKQSTQGSKLVVTSKCCY